MTISQAIGLVADLVIYDPDPALYAERFHQIHDALHDISPIVEAGGGEHEGRWFVGMDGLAPLYGDAPAQLDQLQQVVWRVAPTLMRHTSIQLGWGGGKFVAWVASATNSSGTFTIVPLPDTVAFLSNHSVRVLPVSKATIERLERLGLSTLGRIARLPETALTSQFGRQGRRVWRLATGKAQRPVRAELPDDPIRVALDLPAPTSEQPFLVRALDRLIIRALQHGKRRGRSVRAASLTARLEQGNSWNTRVVCKEPTSDHVAIARLFRHRLTLQPPQGQVTNLSLRLTGFGPSSTQQQLFRYDESSAARANRRGSLNDVVAQLRLRHMKLFRVMELSPWSRIPERRHALIDFDP